MPNYRAIVSIPIEAPDDLVAVHRAFEYAASLRHPDSDVVAGHCELVCQADGTRNLRDVWREHALTDTVGVPQSDDVRGLARSIIDLAERAQLGMAIREGRLPPNHMRFSPRHQLIADAVELLFTTDQEVDLVGVVRHLRESGQLDVVGGPAYIAGLLDMTDGY